MTKMKNTIMRFGLLFLCACFLQSKSWSQDKTTQQKTADITSDWKIGIQTWTFRMFTLPRSFNKSG
jgi:hypothetical protein